VKILAVDDNEENLYLMEVMLKGRGYEVALSRNGAEALEKLNGDSFDLIISDILMPKMDGYSLCREVKKDENLKNIPFIFYTATYTSKADERFALGLGADKFIIKPEEPEVFLKIISEIILKAEDKRLIGQKKYEMDDGTFLKIYNERLINKLETRIVQLQEANQALENEIQKKKKLMKKLEKSEKNYRELVETINDVIFILDEVGNVTYISPVIEYISNYQQEELLGHSFTQFVHPDDIDELTSSMQRAMAGDLEPSEFRICDKNGNLKYVRTSSRPFISKGRVIGLRGVMVDITQRKSAEDAIKKSLEEKEVLLREIHHRVKNNLQVISSLLHLQELSVEKEEVVDLLKESGGRVRSMAMIHEKLYQSPSFTHIPFKDYILKLLSDIFYSYGIPPTGSIETKLDIEDLNVNIDTAIPLGLIINELVTNSVKYAFPEGKGTIKIELKSLTGEMKLTIADNGIGLPKDIDLETTETLGLKLVYTLVNQLEGKLKMSVDDGTEFIITFKEVEYKKRI
jgi:PAS domain S-box-containing protein